MMEVDVITLFPTMFSALDYGVVGRAQDSQRLKLSIYALRNYTENPSNRVDDRPYGGGPGMILQYEPLEKAIQAALSASSTPSTLLYLSPQGAPLSQSTIKHLAQQPRLTLLCGRYEGIDERIIDRFVDQELSVGDYIVSGGELPAMLLIDAVTRMLPGVLGHEQSAVQDSFSEGLLDHPHYTRPRQINQQTVPSVLLSGNHEAITRWRQQQALGKTWQKRPDLLKRRSLTAEEKRLLDQYIKNSLDQ